MKSTLFDSHLPVADLAINMRLGYIIIAAHLCRYTKRENSNILKILKMRKLSLILDIDHTLVNSVKRDEIMLNPQWAKNVEKVKSPILDVFCWTFFQYCRSHFVGFFRLSLSTILAQLNCAQQKVHPK